MTNEIIIRWLGTYDYQTCWDAMRKFTDQRDDKTADEIWLLEHPPIFTQGQNGKPEHLLNPGSIPIFKTDRGGQVTYHGPGQLIMYPLINIQRKKMNVRQFVTLLEKTIIVFLEQYKIHGISKCEAPGVYVNHKKISSIGLRIRRGCSYHGLAFNVAMDLSPFSQINPCGFSNLEMTQLSELGGPHDVKEVGMKMADLLKELLEEIAILH